MAGNHANLQDFSQTFTIFYTAIVSDTNETTERDIKNLEYVFLAKKFHKRQ